MALEQELALLLPLVWRCGELALRIQAGGMDTLQTAAKSTDQSPVTQADLRVEAMLLAAISEHFPDDAVLAEESAGASAWQRGGRVWMIDPIDGTRDFAEGDRSWAIHIGLVIDGHPALGVVHEPGHDRLNWAIDHAGQRLFQFQAGREGVVTNGLAQPPRAPQHRLLTSKSHRSDRLDAVMQTLEITPAQTLRTASTGVKLAMLARGEADLYAHPAHGTKLWDSCAPQVLLHAAGGQLSDMTGAPLPYTGPNYHNARGLLATAPGREHEALVEQLQPLVAQWF